MADEEAIPKTMRALIKKQDVTSFVLEEVPVPEPGPEEVLIRVEYNGLCGSDILLYQWGEQARIIASLPFTPGHESGGIIVKLGRGVSRSDLRLGQRVAVENHYYCGQCYQCQHDRRDICSDLGQYGHGRKTQYGGCSEYTVVPEKYLYAFTSDISAEEATLMEPLGVSHNAVEQLEVNKEAVLVTGCGPIGLLACSVAKALGASKVYATDILDERLTLARGMGADVVFNCRTGDLHKFIMKETSGVGIGRICEATGAPSIVNSMFTLLRKGGHVVMVGLPKQPLHVENPMQNILFKNVQLRTVHGRRIFHTWREIERLVSEKKVDVTKIISHRISLSRFEEAYETLISGKCCKVLIDPQK